MKAASATKLRCNERVHGRTCQGIVGIYYAPYRKVRKLERGETASPPNSVHWCMDCGAKWEVAPPLKEVA